MCLLLVVVHRNLHRGVQSRGGSGVDGSEPRLLRFLGRPNDTAPKALAKMMLGHPLPFDRHDWVVDRGGDEVRGRGGAPQDVVVADERPIETVIKGMVMMEQGLRL